MDESQLSYDHTVLELFENQVLNTPHGIAVRYDNHEISYLVLNEKANQLAYWLQQHQVVPGDFVAVLLEPSIDYMICILAIIKLGGSYLPLDALAPHQRLVDIVEDASPKCIITGERYIHHFKNHQSMICLIKSMHLESASYPKENLSPQITSASPLYMMYTSGSTGIPKGVIIPHRAVVNLVFIDRYAEIQGGQWVAQFSNLAFDANTFEIWGALLNGATLVIVPQEVRTDLFNLQLFIQSHTIDYLFLPTSFFHQIVKSMIDVLDPVKVIIFGGEQINTTLLKHYIHHRKKNKLPVTLINGYGPTEATTFTCRRIYDEQSDLSDDEFASIGQPIQNVKAYILDENKQPSDEGELYIGGVNLALGYHNCPHQNENKFIQNPFFDKAPFERLYRTGDKVRGLSSGNLLHLGRLDDQVKIGGFRIHLSEIEKQLVRHPDISLAAVKVEIGGGAHQLLTAYLVLTSKDKVIDAESIRRFLSDTLPAYMLPAKYCLVEFLPLNRMGKVDKEQLEDISHTDLSFHQDISLISQIEEQVKKVWMHLLNRTSIDVDKNLFELGVNSLLMTEACTRINQVLHSELQVSNLITYPTIRKLSRYLEGDLEEVVLEARCPQIVGGDIAIIGLSCRFPQSDSIQSFWENLCDGTSCLTRFTEETCKQSNPHSKVSHKHFVPVRGVLSDIEQFDANFFGFNPADASMTDPQQRVFLECAWEALEHAGVAPSQMGAKKISVFAGMSDSTYLHENLLKNNWVHQEHDRFGQRIASSMGMLSTQVSYRLNLKGRSLNINTACSTGLATVAQACEDLRMGGSDVALAGAVSIVVPQQDGYLFREGSIESPDGVCRPFDMNANGTVFSNGCGVVILKRLEEAITDNDTIYGVIKGMGMNNDGGDKLGFTAPSTHGQMGCVRDALVQARVHAEEIGFVEAHGTATALGDVVEVEALSAVYREQTKKEKFCVLGSVKGNIGHTDVASGMAGLIKAVLCLYHQKIPPTLHFKMANPTIQFETSPFWINQRVMDWRKTKQPRYAGVSSFGVGGTNVHLILGEHEQQVSTTSRCKTHLFIFSAKSEGALLGARKKWDDYLSRLGQKKKEKELADIAYTLQTGREAFQWRCFGVGSTGDEIKKSIQGSKMYRCDIEHQPNVIFMFPGQGMQYHQMAIGLMDDIPYFADWVKKGFELSRSHLQVDLLEILNNEDERIHQTQYAQPLLFIIEFALAQLLIYYGVRPNGLIGHSLGEYVAACLAGVFSFEDGIALVCQRGLLMASAPEGAMLAISCSGEAFANYQTGAELALQNSTQHCVATGTVAEMAALEKQLKKASQPCKRLKVNHAFHSRLMEPIEQSFKDLFANITLHPPKISMISNVSGTWTSSQEVTTSDYWYKHLRQPVRFCQGLETILKDEHALFIEVGPGQSLIHFLQEVNTEKSKQITLTHVLPTYHRQKTDLNQFLTSLGSMWQAGIPIQWNRLYENERRLHKALPTYAFQKQRYWIDPEPGFEEKRDPEPKMYQPAWTHQPAYLHPVKVSSKLVKSHDWIIIKDNLGLSDKLVAQLEKQHICPIIITFGNRYVKADERHFEINPAEKEHFFDLFSAIKSHIRNPILLHLASYSKCEEGLPSSAVIDSQLNYGFYSLLYLTQAYLKIIGEQQPLKVGVLTAGTQLVLGTETINPIHATLIGACRVISKEHPILKFKIMDLSPVEHPEKNKNFVNKLLDVCLNDTWDDNSIVTAYRHGYEWCLFYATIVPLRQKINRLRNEGVYLLTGGVGGIALSCCEAIAKSVKSPVFILLSRNEFPDETKWEGILQNTTHPYFEKVTKIRSLQKLGGTCYFYQVNINDFLALKNVINEAIERHGSINGVIHCAGVPGGGLVQFKTKRMVQDVFFPKVYGTYHLARSLEKQLPDFVILMSSIAAITGESGQIDYSAANSCLDAFGLSSLFTSSFVCSINWNTWSETGMAFKLSSKSISFLGRGNDISTIQGETLFLEVLKQNSRNIVISNFDVNKVSTERFQNETKLDSGGIKISRQDLNVNTSYSPPLNEVESKLAQIWQVNLGVQDIGREDDFFALGGHSLKALSLIEKINHDLGCHLTLTQLYQSPTIKALSAKVVSDVDNDNQVLDVLIPLKIKKKNPPFLFLCHPANGMIYCFNSFTAQCTSDISIYGLQDPSIQHGSMLYDSVLSMADAYLRAIKSIQPHGPYFFLGYSFGGNILYEIANILSCQYKEEIGLLAMIDSWSSMDQFRQNEEQFRGMFHRFHKNLPSKLVALAWERMKLLLNHTPTCMNQKMILFKASRLVEGYKAIDEPLNGWSNYNVGEITCYKINANHETIINKVHSQTILRILFEQNFLPNLE